MDRIIRVGTSLVWTYITYYLGVFVCPDAPHYFLSGVAFLSGLIALSTMNILQAITGDLP